MTRMEHPTQPSAPPAAFVGRLLTAGRITTCDNYPQEFEDDLNYQTTSGLLIEMSDDALRAVAGASLGQEVVLIAKAVTLPTTARAADVDELKRQLATANQHREDLIRINGQWTAWGAEVLGTHTSDDGYRQAILHMLGSKVGPRQSIAAFLWSEAKRFDNAAETFEQALNASSADRCRVKAGHTRTLATQIERGRDMDGVQ